MLYGIDPSGVDAVLTLLSPIPPYKPRDPEIMTWYCNADCLHALSPSLIHVRTMESTAFRNDTAQCPQLFLVLITKSKFRGKERYKYGFISMYEEIRHFDNSFRNTYCDK